jgi:hypothetical protein
MHILPPIIALLLMITKLKMALLPPLVASMDAKDDAKLMRASGWPDRQPREKQS